MPWESHYLMAVVDSGDVIDESNESNNDAVFRGAFVANGLLSIYGDDTANTIEITDDGANFLEDIDEQTIVRRSPLTTTHKRLLMFGATRAEVCDNACATAA